MGHNGQKHIFSIKQIIQEVVLRTHVGFSDLEKAFETVKSQKLWDCLLQEYA